MRNEEIDDSSLRSVRQSSEAKWLVEGSLPSRPTRNADSEADVTEGRPDQHETLSPEVGTSCEGNCAKRRGKLGGPLQPGCSRRSNLQGASKGVLAKSHLA